MEENWFCVSYQILNNMQSSLVFWGIFFIKKLGEKGLITKNISNLYSYMKKLYIYLSHLSLPILGQGNRTKDAVTTKKGL